MYKKIDVFYHGRYLYSTNMYRTCREAKQNLIDIIEGKRPELPQSTQALRKQLFNIHPDFMPEYIKANFDHSRK